MATVDKAFFARAAAEVAAGNVDQALYIKALATSHGDEVKARALYIALRAEELQTEGVSIARQEARTRAVLGASGFGVILVKVVLAICSLVVPGSGQLISKRFRQGAIFLAFWASSIAFSFLNYRFLHWVDVDTPFSSLPWGQAALLIVLSIASWVIAIWAAVDAFLGNRSHRTSNQAVAAIDPTQNAT